MRSKMHAHAGTGLPDLPDGTEVTVMFRDGTTSDHPVDFKVWYTYRGSYRAPYNQWKHDGGALDIVAYWVHS